jgi:hypothetical protein
MSRRLTQELQDSLHAADIPTYHGTLESPGPDQQECLSESQ